MLNNKWSSGVLLSRIRFVKEAEHLPPFPFHAFVFILSGYAGVSVQYCVTDLAQAVHSCVTLCESVEADVQISQPVLLKTSPACYTLNLLSTVLPEVQTVPW